MDTKEKITKILTKKLSAKIVQITDKSAGHLGHAEQKKYGGGHFSLIVISDLFEEKSLLKRHRMVYEALQENLRNNEIHALKIATYTSQEWENSRKR